MMRKMKIFQGFGKNFQEMIIFEEKERLKFFKKKSIK